MKNKKLIVGIGILVIIIVGVIIFIVIRPKEKYYSLKKLDGLWEIYDISFNNIESNIKEITDKPKKDVVFGNLKNVDINVDKGNYYIKHLNSINYFIYAYYYDLIEYNESYHNYLIKYRGKDNIGYLELADLRFYFEQSTFYDRMDSLRGTLDSRYEDDNKLLEIVKDYLDKFNPRYYRNPNLTIEEVFIRYISEMAYISDLSDFVKEEYYDYITKNKS